jgi:bifunctional DNase/RNase
MADGLTEMVVESVRVHGPSGRHVVILKDATTERYLPIWIGPWEASAIASSLQGLTPERPLTHDLFATVLEELGVQVERVVIAELAEETFHARLHLAWHERTIEIDSRPSDALALAVRTGGRIFAAAAVLEQAAVRPSDSEGETGGGPLETTGETVVDPRLDVFRDFVNSLDAEGEGEGGGSSR